MLKISENNGTEEFGLVTPTPGADIPDTSSETYFMKLDSK